MEFSKILKSIPPALTVPLSFSDVNSLENKKTKITNRAAFSLLLVIMFLFVTGCTFKTSQIEVDNLTKARDAISKRNYTLASRYAKLVLELEPENTEAGIILTYIEYDDNMLLAAFWQNNLDAIRYLAPIVPDINKEDPRFKAPVLVLAAAWGQTNMVKILLEAGADPNYGSDKDGYTALMWACKNFDEQLDMAIALLEAGADINAKSNYNETPLMIAEEYMNPNIVLLINEYSKMLKE